MAGEVVATESERKPKQVNQSLVTVLVAFVANLLIAIAKSVACWHYVLGIDACRGSTFLGGRR
jgi:hypothetical protein